jgi:hypothetical protein
MSLRQTLSRPLALSIKELIEFWIELGIEGPFLDLPEINVRDRLCKEPEKLQPSPSACPLPRQAKYDHVKVHIKLHLPSLYFKYSCINPFTEQRILRSEARVKPIGIV